MRYQSDSFKSLKFNVDISLIVLVEKYPDPDE